MSEYTTHREWSTDESGLPCFDFWIRDDENPGAAFRHLISTGHLSAMADRFGNVNLFTTEGGFVWINSPASAIARSSLYMMMEIDGELVSLLFSELTEREKIRFGTGYIEYHGEVKVRDAHLRIVQKMFAPPDRKRAIYGDFSILNLAREPLKARLYIHSDVTPEGADVVPNNPKSGNTFVQGPGVASFANVHTTLGDVFLKSDPDWQPSARRMTLRLDKEMDILPGKSLEVVCHTGYGACEQSGTDHQTFEKSRNLWSQKLAPFAVNGGEDWMRQECLWNAGQLLSFTSYDSSVDEYFIALGGYGWAGFGVREVSETSMVLAARDWELAASSLRFVAKTQLSNGDVCKFHNMRRDRPASEFDSDTELWFVLGCCESITATGKFEFLDEVCSYWIAVRGRYGNISRVRFIGCAMG